MTDIKEMKNINEYESAEAFYKEYTEGAIYDQQDVELSLEKPALLVVDMLNDFAHPVVSCIWKRLRKRMNQSKIF